MTTTPTTQREVDEIAQLRAELDATKENLRAAVHEAWKSNAALTQARAATDQPSPGQVDELLPCPFCGGAAEVYPGKGQYVHIVGCTLCRAETFGMTEEQARAAWNCRASITPTAPQAASQQAEQAEQAELVIPDGCKLVPVEPTMEMRRACYDEYHRTGATYDSLARAVIAAAPQAATTASASQVDQSMALPSHTTAEWASDKSDGGHND